jgi:hypothetical protein
VRKNTCRPQARFFCGFGDGGRLGDDRLGLGDGGRLGGLGLGVRMDDGLEIGVREQMLDAGVYVVWLAAR